jgi:steroid delta-isomerase-like uncharacterized protein
MSESTNSALVRRWLHEVWNERRDDTVHELMDPGAVGHLEGLATRGVDEFLRARSYLLDAFPDFRVTVDAIIADGDQVVVRWSATGSHRGQLLDAPPTGKAVAFHGITWFVLANGRIVEGWDVWNQGRLLAELQRAA